MKEHTDADRQSEEKGQTETPILAGTMKVLAQVGELMRKAPAPSRDNGELPCPACETLGLAGTVKFAYVKVAHGSRRNYFGGRCTREGCINFSGH